MRWFLVITAAVAAFLVMVVVVGLFLPRRNRVAASGFVPADPDRVWELLADPHGYPEWRPGIMSVEPAGEPGLIESGGARGAGGSDAAAIRWKETSVPGSAVMEEEESVPGKTWTVGTVEHDLPFSVRRRYELEAEGDGTRVTITEERDVGHPGFRFLFRFLVAPEKRILEDLRGLRDFLAKEA